MNCKFCGDDANGKYEARMGEFVNETWNLCQKCADATQKYYDGKNKIDNDNYEKYDKKLLKKVE